jgi:hypothetical protein
MLLNKLPETFTYLNIKYMPLLILLLHILLKQHDLRALTAPRPADKYKSL